MLNDYQNYEIVLEDYSVPRYTSGGKSYFGTMDEIVDLMVYLEEKEETRIRYAELADAIAIYDSNMEMTHVVNGESYSVLSEVDILARNDLVLENQRWTYTGCSGAAYPMFATRVNVSRLIIRDKAGSIKRCIKAEFDGLRICAHGIGWFCPGSDTKGFPGMVTYKDGKYVMKLYALERIYDSDDLGTAIKDLSDISKIDLQTASEDIIGEV